MQVQSDCKSAGTAEFRFNQRFPKTYPLLRAAKMPQPAGRYFFAQARNSHPNGVHVKQTPGRGHRHLARKGHRPEIRRRGAFQGVGHAADWVMEPIQIRVYHLKCTKYCGMIEP